VTIKIRVLKHFERQSTLDSELHGLGSSLSHGIVLYSWARHLTLIMKKTKPLELSIKLMYKISGNNCQKTCRTSKVSKNPKGKETKKPKVKCR